MCEGRADYAIKTVRCPECRAVVKDGRIVHKMDCPIGRSTK